MKYKNFFIILLISILFNGCQTIKKKSDAVALKENQKYGKFVGKKVDEIKIELGNPTEDFINEKGNLILIYKTKKYGIPCERKFELDQNKIITSFTSSGCI